MAVIGGGNSALDATLQLIKIANKIYLINANEKLAGDAVMRDKIEKSDKVTVINKTNTKEILGDTFANGIIIETDGKKKKLDVQGVFIEIGSAPNTAFIDFIEKNEWEEIIVDCSCRTSAPGLFAAGDVTSVPEKQIIVAAGEGCKASLAAFKYLSKLKE